MNKTFSKHSAIRLGLGLGVSTLALGAQQASAQVACPGGADDTVCQVTVTGTSGAIVGTTGKVTVVSNSGTITGAPAISQSGSVLLVVDNKTGGTITGTGSTAISAAQPAISFYLRNAGTINGDVVFNDATAAPVPFLRYQGGTNIYVSDGGTLNGNLTLGTAVAGNPGSFLTSIFLQRGEASGVTGTINAGNGLDIYARSYSGTQAVTLGGALNTATITGFEIAGYEAFGADSVLTLNAAAGTSAEGFNLIGEGSVIVNGTITRPSTAGAGFAQGQGPIPVAIGYSGVPGVTTPFLTQLQATANGQPLYFATQIGGGLKAFTNNGTVQGDVRVITAAFTNAGALELQTRSPGTVITAKSNTDFTFTNTGTISQTYNGARFGVTAPSVPVTPGFPPNPGGAETQLGYETLPAVRLQSAADAATPAKVTVTNSGSITGGLHGALIAKDFVFANTGTIGGINQSGFAALGVNMNIGWRPLTLDGLAEEVDADTATITNGAGATIADGAQFELAANQLTFRNDGTITASTRQWDEGVALAISQYLPSDDDDGADRDAASFDFTNAGTITGSVNIDFEGTAAALQNSGRITRELLAIDQGAPPTYGNREAFRFENESNGDQTLTFTNSGRIETKDKGSSALVIEVDAGRINDDGEVVTVNSSNTHVVNGGRIEASGGALAIPGPLAGYGQNQVLVRQSAALVVDAGEATGESDVLIENLAGGRIVASGLITTLTRNQGGEYAYQQPPQASSVHTVAVAATGDRITLINSGLISGSGGTDFSAATGVVIDQFYGSQPHRYLAGAIHFGGYEDDDGNYHASTDLVRNLAGGAISGSIDLGDGDDVLENFGEIYDVAGNRTNVFLGGGNDTFLYGAGSYFEGQADGGSGTDSLKFQLVEGSFVDDRLLDQFINFERTTMEGLGAVRTTRAFAIEDGSSLTLDGPSIVNTGANLAISGGDGAETLVNYGSITGNIVLGGGNDSLSNYGAIYSNIDLGDGDDTLTHFIDSIFEGLADGGAGTDTLIFDLTGSQSIVTDALRAKFINFEIERLIGQGTIVTENEVVVNDGGSLDLQEGSNVDVGAGNTAISGGTGAESVTNQGSVTGNVDLGGGNNQFANQGTVNGNVVVGAGDNQVANNGGTLNGNVQAGDGNNVVSNGQGGTIAGNITAGNGNNQIGNAAGAAIVGDITTGSGNNQIANGQGSTITGNIQTGGGNNTITNAGGTITGSIATGNGDNTIVNEGPAATSTMRVLAGGGIDGGITTGSGNDNLVNRSVITGNVDLGNGNNTVTLGDGGQFGGTVTAGTGSDRFTVQTSGTYQSPTEVNGSSFTGFETLQNTSGTTRMTGSFAGGVDVTGGYLFGAAGSSITGNVGVGTGAQFGTSGTVNGNVTVASGATLAPGSSPGIMTVNGNVSLAAGSTSTFEFVPAPGQSDQLLISGTLTIAANTTLNMTGTRPLTPGVNYDLIVADGGITGTFATVNKPSTIGGFLRYTPNRLQLMGTFLAPTGLNAQQLAAVDYVNTVLIDGQGSTALFAGIPGLLATDGTASAAAFGLLTPEAYASASQLGIENGLTLAQAGRTGIARTDRQEAGLFVFAQGMGDRRTLKAGAAAGTSRARNQSWGMLGGLGYGDGGASIGAFVGYLDSNQRIGALGARTEGDGVVAGLAGHFVTQGFEFSLLGAYDWTKADTERSVPGGQANSAEYRLRGLVIDASVGYNIAAGADWSVRPQAGITHIDGTRGATSETGSAAFALAVDRDRYSATFIDGSLAIKGGQAEGAAFHPWLQAGLRHQIRGDLQSASAGFVGTTSRFTVVGASRKETVVTAGAGFGYDIGGVTLFAAYQGEFGGGSGHNGNVGIRMGF